VFSNEFLTVKELANFLKLKPQTLYPKVRKGEVPVTKVFGSYRFRKSDIDKWLSKNVRPNIKIQRESQIQQPVVSQS